MSASQGLHQSGALPLMNFPLEAPRGPASRDSDGNGGKGFQEEFSRQEEKTARTENGSKLPRGGEELPRRDVQDHQKAEGESTHRMPDDSRSHAASGKEPSAVGKESSATGKEFSVVGKGAAATGSESAAAANAAFISGQGDKQGVPFSRLAGDGEAGAPADVEEGDRSIETAVDIQPLPTEGVLVQGATQMAPEDLLLQGATQMPPEGVLLQGATQMAPEGVLLQGATQMAPEDLLLQGATQMPPEGEAPVIAVLPGTAADLRHEGSLNREGRGIDPFTGVGQRASSPSTGLTGSLRGPEGAETLSNPGIAEGPEGEIKLKGLQQAMERLAGLGEKQAEVQKGIDVALSAVRNAAESMAPVAQSNHSQLQQAYKGDASSSVTLSLPQQFGTKGWGEGLSERVLWMANQKAGIAELRLDPPDLGRIHIRLSISQEQASISFTSPHANVREVIEQQLSRLREMLADNGLELQHADVSDQSERSFGSRSDDEAGEDGRDGFLDQASESTDEGLVTGQPLGLVDYYV